MEPASISGVAKTFEPRATGDDAGPVGDPEHFPLATTGLSDCTDQAKDAETQRHRGMADDAHDALGTSFTACEVTKTSATGVGAVQDD